MVQYLAKTGSFASSSWPRCVLARAAARRAFARNDDSSILLRAISKNSHPNFKICFFFAVSTVTDFQLFVKLTKLCFHSYIYILFFTNFTFWGKKNSIFRAHVDTIDLKAGFHIPSPETHSPGASGRPFSTAL